jgi:MOSC domain-containing protein YiiM
VGEVLHLFQSIAKGRPMHEIDEVPILENKGLEGCIHGRAGSNRQVSLMDIETLDQFALAPGRIKENITTRGIAITELRKGHRIRAGKSILEVHAPCEPCEFIEGIRPGLQQAMAGRRGVLCRVIQTGIVRRGDAVEVMERARGAHLEM